MEILAIVSSTQIKWNLLAVAKLDDTAFYRWAEQIGYTRAPLETISNFRTRVIHCVWENQ